MVEYIYKKIHLQTNLLGNSRDTEKKTVTQKKTQSIACKKWAHNQPKHISKIIF